MLKKIIFFILSIMILDISSAHSKVRNLKEVEDASVMVVCRTKWFKQNRGGGSASRIYHTPNGPWILLTAHHVLEGCSERGAELVVMVNRNLADEDGFVYKQEPVYLDTAVVAQDAQHDIAIIQTKRTFPKQAVYYDISPVDLKYLEPVWTAGYPSPFRWPQTIVMSHGVVNAPLAPLPVCDVGNSGVNVWYCMPDESVALTTLYLVMTDAEQGPGNSGGTLFNRNFDLVGVTVAGMSMGNYRPASIPTKYINALVLKTKYAGVILKKAR